MKCLIALGDCSGFFCSSSHDTWAEVIQFFTVPDMCRQFMEDSCWFTYRFKASKDSRKTSSSSGKIPHKRNPF